MKNQNFDFDTTRLIPSVSDKSYDLTCRIAIIKIKAILENTSLTDAECFEKIEAIVSCLENSGISIQYRHDF